MTGMGEIDPYLIDLSRIRGLAFSHEDVLSKSVREISAPFARFSRNIFIPLQTYVCNG